MFCVLNHFLYVIAFVDINEAKLVEINAFLVVIVQDLKDTPIVFKRHINPTPLNTIHKLMKFNQPIEIHVKHSEHGTIVFKLLFEPIMNLSKQLLNMSNLIPHLFLVFNICQFLLFRGKVLKALDVVRGFELLRQLRSENCTCLATTHIMPIARHGQQATDAV